SGKTPRGSRAARALHVRDRHGRIIAAPACKDFHLFLERIIFEKGALCALTMDEQEDESQRMIFFRRRILPATVLWAAVFFTPLAAQAQPASPPSGVPTPVSPYGGTGPQGGRYGSS